MSVIQATSVGVKGMADKSLRITFEFEPRHAKEAFNLFGEIGTACAVAALTQAASLQAAQQETVAAKKPGPLCVLACQWCKLPDFWEFVQHEHDQLCERELDAKNFILRICAVESRKELDTCRFAETMFHTLIREPFNCWKAEQ